MNKFNNIFGQILDLFPKLEFLELVRETQLARGTKGFSCWDQFVTMMFCQLGRANSLREICYGLGTYLVAPEKLCNYNINNSLNSAFYCVNYRKLKKASQNLVIYATPKADPRTGIVPFPFRSDLKPETPVVSVSQSD